MSIFILSLKVISLDSYMSDYTNRNIYGKSYHVQSLIGGDTDNIKKSSEYVKNQIDIIQEHSSMDGGKNGVIGSRTKKDKTQNYTPIDNRKDRYDPYIGHLQKYGLTEEENRNKRKVTYLNINSKDRDRDPSIISEESVTLDTNPISFTNGSKTIFVTHIGHTFSKNDRITLTGITTKRVTLRTIIGSSDSPTYALDFINSSEYMTLRMKNVGHGIPSTYTGTSIKITISGIKGDAESTYINNIPINTLNKTHTVHLVKPTETDVPAESYDGEKLYIKLPKAFVGNYTREKYNFYVKLSAIAGVPLGYLNARYPIDIDHFQGFFNIENVTSNGYYININKEAIVSGGGTVTSGGSNIEVARIEKIITGYTDPNKYKYVLPHIFNEIVSITLVSSEFPNSKKVIRDYGDSRNNRLHWQNLDDGDHVYYIDIEPGNYTPEDLIVEIQSKFYDTTRLSFSGNTSVSSSYTNSHYVQMTMNMNTNVTTFKSYKEAILTKPITNINPDIQEKTALDNFSDDVQFEITITHSNHGLSSGDKILIAGAISHMGIPTNILNKEHTILKVNDDNEYVIKLDKFNLSTASRIRTNGGVSVYVYAPDTFRLRLDQTDSIAGILGFRNVGEDIAITPYNSTITNKDAYELDNTFNQLGESMTITNNSINLSGDDYILMVVKQISTMVSNGAIKNAFAKIQLTDSPGNILYNTFVSAPKIYIEPLPELHELDFEFYSPDGSLYDFSGLDHSFTLELTTLIEMPSGTNISSRTGRILR